MFVSLILTFLFFCQQSLGQEPTWHGFEGSLYLVGSASARVNFETARSICQSYDGGDLVSITSQEISYFLMGLISERMYFIGLTDRDSEGVFKWLDGSQLNYEHWHYPQPDDWYNEDCVVMDNQNRKGLWNDLSCNTTISSYICAIKDILQLSAERMNPGMARVSCAVKAYSSGDASSSEEIMVSVGSTLSSSRLVAVNTTTVEGNTRKNTYVINNFDENEEIFCSFNDTDKDVQLYRQLRPDQFYTVVTPSDLPTCSSTKLPSCPTMSLQQPIVTIISWTMLGVSGLGNIIFIIVIIVLCLNRKRSQLTKPGENLSKTSDYVDMTSGDTALEERVYENI